MRDALRPIAQRHRTTVSAVAIAWVLAWPGITGAIVGVGAARRAAAVRWPVAQRIVIAWVLTLPAAGLIGALVYRAVSYF